MAKQKHIIPLSLLLLLPFLLPLSSILTTNLTESFQWSCNTLRVRSQRVCIAIGQECRNRAETVQQQKHPVGEEALSIGIENGKQEEARSQLCESRRHCRSTNKIKSQMQIQCKSVAKDNSALRTKGIQGDWKTYLQRAAAKLRGLPVARMRGMWGIRMDRRRE